ncbi:receptor protein EIX2 [Trifolium repens]|nr:receptor protein EIX2 [Trifolium repens]
MSTNEHRLVRCNEKDQKTLLIFKKGLNDSLYGKISTWSTKKDCCAWEGVHCDNITGRVTELDLNDQYLKGEVNLSNILELEFLSYLDLGYNFFDVINIPATQHNITHKSNLFYLDLSDNFVGLHMDNLDWLSPLSSLKYLNLSGIDLHKETNWLQAVNTLPSLLELQLRGCKLNNFIINPSIEYLNLSSLLTLDLSHNNFTSQLPNWFFNLTKNLTYLNLHKSNIHGEIPSSLLNLHNLRFLDLSYNMLSGSIPSTVGNLSSLNYLDIGHNNFSGEISKLTFSKLSSLDSLNLASLNVVFHFDFEWVPPFQLQSLDLSNTNQGPNFPSWMYTQESLQSLDLSSSGISLVETNKFSSLIERIPDLSLSNNSITVDISNLTLKCQYLLMDRNNFTGGLPNISPNVIKVDLSYNSFSGSIPHSWKNLKSLTEINLWSNKLSGEALVHLSDWTELFTLNLGENVFSGTIPIKMPQNLGVIILRGNQFEGNIPQEIFNLSYLFHLDLANNKLSGSIPNSVYNLTKMDDLPVVNSD